MTADDDEDEDDLSGDLIAGSREPSHSVTSGNRYLHHGLDLAVDRRLEVAFGATHIAPNLSTETSCRATAATPASIMIPPNFSRPRVVDNTTPGQLMRQDSLLNSSSFYSELDDPHRFDAPATYRSNNVARKSHIRVLTSTTGVPFANQQPAGQQCSKGSSSVSDDPFRYDSQDYDSAFHGGPNAGPISQRYRFDVPRDFRLMSQHHPPPSAMDPRVIASPAQPSFYHSAAIRSV